MDMTSRQDRRPDTRQEGADLDRNYGRIGISAVAAALRYASGAKNPAENSRADARADEREHAA
jgi:hypothetical protein